MGNKLAKDKMNLLNRFIDRKIKDSFKTTYSGKVVDNDDPEKIGRCKIRVFGIYGDDIVDDDLPWALPDFEFTGSTIGSFVVPPIDALVKIKFKDGNIYAPEYTTKVLDINNLPTDKDEDYPHTMVLWETDEGEYLKINRKTNETTYHSASGVLLVYDTEGNVSLDTEEADVGDITLKDKHGNLFEMSSDGVKINEKYVLTEDFLEWFNTWKTSFGMGNLGAPVPFFPGAMTDFVDGSLPDNFKTDR